ncbi:hypothetical protein [Falsiroseomonas oryzae]|uniref:hypothetical protein n=1 Tax=Falsiroseomonas oryzae TaxID=2766473 RepID=UPI0022EA4531|nr:hypothetical protein [Roseomonas sp. MO-31]
MARAPRRQATTPSASFTSSASGSARKANGGAEALAAMPDFGVDRASWTDHDSLEAEQAGFVAACLDAVPPVVRAREGIAALKVALAVEAAIG